MKPTKLLFTFIVLALLPYGDLMMAVSSFYDYCFRIWMT